MGSKAEYLKRYASGSGGDNDEGKKKKKSKGKESKKKKESGVTKKVAGGMKIFTEDDALPSSFLSSRNGFAVTMDGEEEPPNVLDMKDEEDDPLVVNDGSGIAVEWSGTASSGVGSWESTPGIARVAVMAAPSSSSRPQAAADSDSDSDSPPRRRRRHDSDSEGERAAVSSTAPSGRMGGGNDSASDSPPRRRTSRSSSSSSSDGGRRRARHDSDSDGSDSDASVVRRPKAAVEQGATTVGDGGEGRRQQVRAKLSSGHDAGLQSGAQFGEKERLYRAAQEADMRKADPTLSGAHAATVYRDKKGNKLDMLNEFMRQQAMDAGKEAKLAEAMEAWGQGTAQKLAQEKEAEYLASMAQTSFTRYADDAEVETAAKQAIHEEDPMAAYFLQKQEMEVVRTGGAQASARPVYKGPPAPPNRFRIKPGYRWDGVDRSNGWEAKVLQKAR